MKKCHLLIFLSYWISVNQSLGQVNLVSNPGFEDVNCVSQRAINWRGFFTTFHDCFPLGFSPGGNLKPPYINPDPWSYSVENQLARTGKGFAGIQVSNGRGYLVATLKEELKQYKTYFTRFYVMPYYPIYDWIKWPYTDAVGLYVTPFDYTSGGGVEFPYLGEKPVIENSGKIIRDTTNWTRVSGAFNARGQENFVVIANFKSNQNTNIDFNGYITKAGQYPNNMFFVDDVVVSEFDPLPDTAILCANAPLVFDATFYDAEYRWSDFSENNKLVVTKPGQYWVQARIDGVLLQDEVLVVAEKEFLPLPKDTVVCNRGPVVTLSVNAKAKYNWSTGQTSKSISIGSAGKYTVTITTPQCTLQFSTDVKARECSCDFFTPNSFTPNDDGNNDTFKPFINCKIVTIDKYRFSVFNRFGNMMFSTTNIDESWDGYYRGQPCSDDVYAWFVEYNTIIDGKTQYKRIVESGDVTIMR
jgi:gliding motility-associated-like protein